MTEAPRMNAIELFSGAGGLGMGVSSAGFKPVSVVEWDKWCCDTISRNRNASASLVSRWPEPICADIRDLEFSRFAGKVELVSGGPPCQPFSLGGKHAAQKDARDMWPEAVRVVRETHPRAFMFENVKGLTRARFERYFSYILLQLSHPEIERYPQETWDSHLAHLERHHTAKRRATGLEYHVVSRVINAADYGVPQRRERVVFVGFRSDVDASWNFPDPSHGHDALVWSKMSGEYWDRHTVSRGGRRLSDRDMSRAAGILEKPTLSPWLTTRDAISDLPDPETNGASSMQFADHKFQPGARSYPGHTGSPLDEPAKTIKAGVHGVPGGENTLIKANGKVRYFTIRETARLQTFPDDFRLHGSWTEAMRQLGNAVPVKLAAIIARSVASHLGGKIA
jgi:DNA (cytosine-5)-methyltransferase 1